MIPGELFEREHENNTNSMKRLLLAAFAAPALLGIAQAQIVSFSSTALGNGNTAVGTTVNATTLGTGMGSGVVARGSGVALGAGSSRYNSAGFNVANAAAAISGNKYISITLAPSANYSYSLTSLGATLGASGTGPTSYGVYAGVPGFTASTQLATGSVGSSSAVTPSLGSGFTNLTTATEIRIYGWGASGAAGTFGPGNSQPLNVNGTTALRSAGTLTWDGGQGNGNWNSYTATAANQSNWNANNIPASGLVDSLTFAGSTQTTTSNNISSLTVGSITFASGANAFTNGGNSLTLNDGITNSSSNLQTINHAIVLSGGAHTITGATGNVAIGGAISGAGSINKTGANTLTLSVANSYSGGTTISAGTLVAGNASALGGGLVTINGGALGSTLASVNAGGISMSSGNLTLNGASTGALSLASGADVTFTGGMWNLSIASLGSFDSIDGGGAGSTFTISGTTLALGGVIAAGEYVIFQDFSGGSGTFFDITGYDESLFTAAFTIDGGIGTLSLTAIPEPHEYALGFGLMLVALVAIRRRKAMRA